MAIYLDTGNDATICTCNACGEVVTTSKANGIVPEGWGTGHLWLDVSINQQRQVPMAWCPACAAAVMAAEAHTVTP